jgi:hypothetical protein
VTAQAGMPLDFWEQVRKVAAEEVAKYARSGSSRNTSITGGSGMTIGGGGSLVVDGGEFVAKYPAAEGGGAAVNVGPQYATDTGQYLGTGMLVQAPDGTDMIVARRDIGFNNTRVDIYDSGNRVIVGNDASSGQGLARPYLPGVFHRTRYADLSVATTSATFETLWAAEIHKQHPRMEIGYRGTMDTAGTTGEVQILVNGVAFGTPVSHSFLLLSQTMGPFNVLGGHMDVLTVEIQGRRTSATGALRVEPRFLAMRQSP